MTSSSRHTSEDQQFRIGSVRALLESAKLPTLELVVTTEFFGMIVRGEKPEEYRQVTPYWMARLMEKPVDLDTFMEFRKFKAVRFRLGYNGTRRKRCLNGRERRSANRGRNGGTEIRGRALHSCHHFFIDEMAGKETQIEY